MVKAAPVCGGHQFPTQTTKVLGGRHMPRSGHPVAGMMVKVMTIKKNSQLFHFEKELSAFERKKSLLIYDQKYQGSTLSNI